VARQNKQQRTRQGRAWMSSPMGLSTWFRRFDEHVEGERENSLVVSDLVGTFCRTPCVHALDQGGAAWQQSCHWFGPCR
jgi:hypothetical protein